eukprot:4504118-Prymnesium_polylepis.1
MRDEALRARRPSKAQGHSARRSLRALLSNLCESSGSPVPVRAYACPSVPVRALSVPVRAGRSVPVRASAYGLWCAVWR